jgi:two-component system sensor histidine kinase ResE
MLILPEKVIFRAHIEESVSYEFVNNVKIKMLDSLSSLLNADFKNINIEEKLSGSVLDEESEKTLRSFFNIPLIISGRVAGLLTVASSQSSLFKEEEITTLYKIGQQASQAVTQLQEVVESEKSELNAMVSGMTDGVIMVDKDYRILVVNPTAKKAMGFENEKEPVLQDFVNSLSAKFNLRDKIEESIRLEKVFISDEISLPTGFFKIVSAPVKNKWKLLGCVVVFRDITREKEVERIKDDFTSMIVHELRSPLDSIKKIVESIRSSESKNKKLEDCFQMIYGSAADMLELVNNLLDMAKIEAGKFEILKRPSDIKEIIKNRILFFGVTAKDAKVELISYFGKDMPDKVEFDPHTISQVLNNFISNAIKFNKENGSVVIQALLHKKGENLEREAKDSEISWFIKKDIPVSTDSLIVAVTNSGAGIAPNQIDKLFNKFIQVRSAFAEKEGTGLGLAIAKSIIDSHNGIVGAESIEGEGATFYFTLPITEPEEVANIVPSKK